MAKGLWIVLNVDNVDKSAEFYKALGLKARVESMEMPGVGMASMGTVETGVDAGFVLWNKNVVPPDQPANTRAWVSGELGKGVLIGIGVPNAQKVWANAQKLRAEVEQAIEAQPQGGHGFTIVDLDGYVVQFMDKWPGEPTPKKAKKSAKRAPAKTQAKRAVKAGKRRTTSKRR